MGYQLNQTRILITGVQGQVGFELVKSLSTTGAELILGARKPHSLDGLGYQTVGLDLSHDDNVAEVLKRLRPHIIINPAAYTAVDKAEEETEQAYAVNQRAVATMTHLLREWSGAMIHFSTDYVYNAKHERPNLEEDETAPVNSYAASKLAGEQALIESGIAHIILRTSWVYGINGNNFVKTMLRLGRERESLRIVGDQVGSPTSAVTLAQAVAGILQLGETDPLAFIRAKQGIYNISDSGFTTWYDFAKEIFRQAQQLGIELKVRDVEAIKTQDYKTPAMRPLNSRLSLDKIRSQLSIVPPKWQQSLGAFLHQSNIKLF